MVSYFLFIANITTPIMKGVIFMQINDYNEYDWNRCVAPHGNMGNVDPDIVANLCD